MIVTLKEGGAGVLIFRGDKEYERGRGGEKDHTLSFARERKKRRSPRWLTISWKLLHLLTA